MTRTRIDLGWNGDRSLKNESGYNQCAILVAPESAEIRCHIWRASGPGLSRKVQYTNPLQQLIRLSLDLTALRLIYSGFLSNSVIWVHLI